MQMRDDLLGMFDSDKTLLFSGMDSKNLFFKHLKIMPQDWYYRDVEITYSYNKNGHRCKQIADVDFSNYILFLGDSHTEGVGLELENTYAYKTSKALGCDYYNMGLGGTGIDFMMHNLLVWLSKYPKPKYIVLFFSDENRFMSRAYGGIMPFVENGSWSSDDDSKQFLVSGSNVGFFRTRLELYCLQIKNLLAHFDIPYCNISIFHPNLPYLECKTFDRNMECRARDLQHIGIDTHQLITDYLVSYYHDKYINARDNQDIRGQS